IIIANPPYVKEYTDKSAFDGFRSSPYYRGKMDIWYGFACKSIDMLNSKGIQCFIAQNNWVTSSGAAIMRNKVVRDTQILQLVDFVIYMIFENASIQTMVMLFKKDTSKDDYQFQLRKIVGDDLELTDVTDLLKNRKTENTKYLSPLLKREELIDEY